MKVSSVKGEWKINIQFWYKRKVKEKRNRTIFSNFFPIFWEIPFIWTKFKWKMHRNISFGGSQKCSILQVQLTWVSSFKKSKFDLELFAFKGFKNMTQFSFSLFFLTICFISSFSIETHPRKRRHHKSMLSSMCLTNVPQIELKKNMFKKDEQFWFRHNIANNRGSNTKICKSQWQGFISKICLVCYLFVLCFRKW